MGADLLSVALSYTARGWWVLPLHYPVFAAYDDNNKGIMGRCSCGNRNCSTPAKHPIGALVPKGANSASNDEATVRAWWTKQPNANIGIATGPSGLAILDCDGNEGKAQLIRDIGVIPETLTAKTGREGGFHFYYRGKIPSGQVKGEHLDTRGTSGYVVAPESTHINGTKYEWVNNADVVGVPENIVDWCARRRGGGGRRIGKVSESFSGAGKPVTGSSDAKGDKEPAIPGTNPDAVYADPSPPYGSNPSQEASLLRVPLAGRRTAGEALRKAELPPYSESERDKLCSALKAIPANLDGGKWASFGMALADLEWIVDGVDVGFEIWNAWSRTSQGVGPGEGEYKGRHDLEKRWVKFAPSYGNKYKGIPVTVGSIYQHAKSLGWSEPESVKYNNINGQEGAAEFFGVKSNIKFEDYGPKGKILPTCTNARIAIKALGIECRYDLFHEREYVNGVGQGTREVADQTALAIRSQIRANWRVDPSTQTVLDALTMEGMEHGFDPVLDYLDSLKWDGVPRLRTWTSDFLGSPVSPLNQMIGALALVAAVRRARQPGAKFDHIIVLEGIENIGKSSAIEILAGSDNFSDQSILTLDDRRQQELLQGIWLYEIAELTGIKRAEIEHVKAFITRRVDRTRPAYGRKRVDKPRRCILFATSNDKRYLSSQTGNRRFWSLACGKVDQKGLIGARDQLWAEACTIEKRGAPLVMPEELWPALQEAQEARKIDLGDPWEDIIEQGINGEHPSGVVQTFGNELRVATTSLLAEFFQIEPKSQAPYHRQRISKIMQNLGWAGPKVIRLRFTPEDLTTFQSRGFIKVKNA